MEYINCCNNMNQKPVSMISVDKMITRTDPVIFQGVFAATMGGTFIEIYNYYEQFGYFHYWFK